MTETPRDSPPDGESGTDLATATWRPCAVVPTYNNPMTVERVVRELLTVVDAVFVVDDAGNEEAQAALADVAVIEGAWVRRRERNGGKGAAVKDGLRWALEEGYSHALQVDADGQHDLGDARKLLEASAQAPEALVLGRPLFDESAPRARRWGRQISVFWVWIETLGRPGKIADPLCGYRVYPLAEAVGSGATGDRMDFDPEIAVRMVWRGLPVVNVPTQVRYVPAEEGGVSHYRAFWDNVAISLLHTKLCILRYTGLWRWF